MKKLIGLLFPLLSSTNVHAGLLTTEGSTAKIENINIATIANTSVNGDSVTLKSVGSGIRNKKVVFVNIKVYVGQLFASTPEDIYNSKDLEKSLENQKAVAIQLHFLRDVDAANIEKSFIEALRKNKVEITDESIKKFLDSVRLGGEIKEGQTITILGSKNKDLSESIFHESHNKKFSEIKGQKGFITKIFSIWLGKPTDDGIEKLKESLTRK